MGLFGLHLPKKVDNVFGDVGQAVQGVARQVNTFDNGATYSNPAPQGPRPASFAQQAANVAQPIAQTVDLPFRAARLGFENLSGQSDAANQTRQTLRTDFSNNIATPLVPFERSVATAITSPIANHYATQESNRAWRELTPTYGQNNAEIQAGNIKQSFLNNELNRNGINQNDTLGQTTRKVAGQAGQFGTNLALLGELPNVATGGVVPRLATFGGIGALQGVSQVAQQENPTAGNYFKAGVSNAAQLAALPVATEALKLGVHVTANRTPLNNEIGAVGKDVNGRNLRQFEYNDTPLTPGEKAALRNLEGNQVNANYASAANELRQLAKESGQPELYKKVMGVVSDQKMSQAQATDFIKQGLDQMRSSGTNAKIRMGVGENSPTPVSAVGKNVKVTSDELAMGKALGMTAEDVKKAKSAPVEATPVPIKNTQKTLVAEAQKQASQNPQLGKVGVPEATNAAQAHLNADYIANHEKRIGGVAQTELSKLSPADQELLKSIQIKGVAGVIAKADNPQQFQTAADAIRNYYDLRHAYDHYLGIDTPYRQNYLRDLIDRNQAPEQQFTATGGNKAPGYTQAKTKPGVTNVAEALQRDIAGASFNHGKLTYAQGLEQAYPNQISRGSPVVGAEGVNKQLLTPYGQELFATKDLAKQINSRAPIEKAGGALGAYDTANAGLKQAKLGGGLFHGVTTTGTVAGQQVTSGGLFKHPLENIRTIAGTLSEKAHQANMQGYAERGTLDNARLAGVTLGKEQLLADTNAGKKFSGIPVIKQLHDAVFGRQIPEAKLMIFEQQTKGLDPQVPTDLAKMRQVASAVNNLGGINRAVEGLSPQTAKRLSRVVLATDFTEGKFRTIEKALEVKNGPANKIARQMVVGKTIVFLLPGLAAATAAGKIDWNNPKDVAGAIGGQILDPNIATPFKGKTGIARVAKTPETFVSELGRIVKPFFDGSVDKLSGAKHYASARLAALPSEGVQLGSNQDYQGNPILQRDSNGRINVTRSASSVGVNALPIPISQGIKVAQGKQSAGEAAVNTLGFRVGADKNDPQMKAFAFEQQATSRLSASDKKLWDSVYGANKDQYGNPITVTPALDSQNNAYTLLTNPQLISTGKKIDDYKASQGLPSDPFFKLNSDQQKTVLNLAIDKFRNPDERTTLKNRNKSWLDQYNNDRTNYFSSLNLPPSTKTKELPEPQPPANANDYFSLTDPTQKRDYLANHPEITDYFTAHDNFIREGRAKQGLPQYDKYPTAPPQVEKLMSIYSSLPKNDGPNGKSTTRSNWIKSHPNEWAVMTDQFSKQAQYGLEKDAAQAAYEGQDFSASGIKDIMSLAKDLGVSGGSSGYGGGTANYASKYDPSQYLNHAKTTAPPKLFKAVTVRKIAARGRNYASSGKIKVSSRKAAA